MNWHDAESQADNSPLASRRGADLPVPTPSAKVSPRTALEAYWRHLELTPHRKINLGVTTLQCRVDMLKWAFRLTNGVISPEPDGAVLGMNWLELGVVPVGGQGLTKAERDFCAWAGQAMAAIFAEEGRNHDNAS